MLKHTDKLHKAERNSGQFFNFAPIMANPLKQLAGDTAIYGLSTILARIINFLFVPFYTRLLTTESYGVVTEFMAYIAVLQVILVLGLETGTGDGLLHDHGPEIGGFETGEALAVFSYRRPYGAYDDCFVHGMFPRLVIGVLYKIVSIIKYDH